MARTTAEWVSKSRPNLSAPRDPETDLLTLSYSIFTFLRCSTYRSIYPPPSTNENKTFPSRDSRRNLATHSAQLQQDRYQNSGDVESLRLSIPLKVRMISLHEQFLVLAFI